MLWELHGKEVEAGGNSQGDRELPVRQKESQTSTHGSRRMRNVRRRLSSTASAEMSLEMGLPCLKVLLFTLSRGVCWSG